jgi:hypothetical protein
MVFYLDIALPNGKIHPPGECGQAAFATRPTESAWSSRKARR